MAKKWVFTNRRKHNLKLARKKLAKIIAAGKRNIE